MAGLIASCAPKAAKKTSKAEFSEDLSVYRPQYEEIGEEEQSVDLVDPLEGVYPEPAYDITAQVNTFLDTLAERNRKLNYVEGYTILIRGGSRQEALNIRQMVLNILPDSNPQYVSEPPNHKIKVGKFFTRYEANQVYSKLRQVFPNRAILAPERIYLR